MENNKYLVEFKIDVMKQYLQGRQKKEICEEYGIAKSTMWGWICKYAHLIEKTWEVKGVEKLDIFDAYSPIVVFRRHPNLRHQKKVLEKCNFCTS